MVSGQCSIPWAPRSCDKKMRREQKRRSIYTGILICDFNCLSRYVQNISKIMLWHICGVYSVCVISECFARSSKRLLSHLSEGLVLLWGKFYLVILSDSVRSLVSRPQALMSASSKNDFPGMSRFCAIVNDFMVKKLPFKLKNILWFFFTQCLLHRNGILRCAFFIWIVSVISPLFIYMWFSITYGRHSPWSLLIKLHTF